MEKLCLSILDKIVGSSEIFYSDMLEYPFCQIKFDIPYYVCKQKKSPFLSMFNPSCVTSSQWSLFIHLRLLKKKIKIKWVLK